MTSSTASDGLLCLALLVLIVMLVSWATARATVRHMAALRRYHGHSPPKPLPLPPGFALVALQPPDEPAAPAPSPPDPAKLEALARQLLDPDAYGQHCSPDVRKAARRALGTKQPRSPS